VAKKKLTKEERDLCRMTTPVFRVSFPHLLKPSAQKGGKPKYSVTMLFAKNSDLTGTAPDGTPRSIKEIIKNAKVVSFGSKENWPEGIQSPVTDGDDAKKTKHEGFAGNWAISAKSEEDQPPAVVDINKKPITDSKAIYAGCYARAAIYAHVWEYNGEHGVRFVLDRIQKVKEGKAFSSKGDVNKMFTPLSDDDDTTIEEETESFL